MHIMSNNRLISMLVALGMLSACGEPDDRNRNAQADSGSDAARNVESGADGTTKVSIGIPKIGLPSLKLNRTDIDIDGVKLYPGARVTGIDVSGQEGQSEGGIGIRFDADAKPEAVRDYYLAAFKTKGLQATALGQAIVGRDHEGTPFRIDLEPQGEGTRGVVHVGQKRS